MRTLVASGALASLAATALLSSGCSVFVLLAREARGSGDDGTITVGQTVSGDTNGGVDAVTPGCGTQGGSPERRYFFTAPETRRYLATTASQFDGVLAVYAHGATGEPITCNDDHGSTRASQVAFEAQAGSTYDLVVDGYHGQRGAFTLVIEAEGAPTQGGSTPPVPLASGASLTVGVTVTGSTSGGTDTRTLSCGAPTAGTPDVTYVFTPTEGGVYTFRTQTDYDGTLEVFDGASSLGCNDDDGSTRASRVSATLQGGRTYAVVLDGFGSQSGSFQLVVDHQIAQSASGGAIAVGTPVRGTTVGAPDTITLSCGAPRPGTPDVTFTFVPPEDGMYVFRTQTDYDGTLEVFDDSSASLGCNDDDGSTRASRVTATLSAGRTYRVVLDGYAGGMGSYELSATHPIARPAGPITAGQTVNGSTLSGTDVRTPPCGSAPGTPEQIWTFTPPTTATYRLRLDSSYDGVLAVYPVGAPDPLMCNDDAGSTRASEIEGSLIGGQRYEIVVDGYAGGVGDYTLRLEMLSGVGGAPVAPPSAISSSIHGGPLPENLGEMDARCAAAQVVGTGHHTAVIEPTEGAAQVSCGSGGAGGDQVFTLVLAEASSVSVHAAAEFAVALEVRATCTGQAMQCEVVPPPTGRDFDLALPAGTYIIVVDALESGARGPVHLSLNIRPSHPTPAPVVQPSGG